MNTFLYVDLLLLGSVLMLLGFFLDLLVFGRVVWFFGFGLFVFLTSAFGFVLVRLNK